MSYKDLTAKFNKFILFGYKGELTNDAYRRLRTVNTVSFILLLTLTVFTSLDLFIFNKPYVAVVEAMGVLAGVCYVIVQHRIKSILVITNGSIAILTGILLSINYLNGFTQSNYFWMYLIPPFAFYAGGYISGLFWSGIILIWFIASFVLTSMGLIGTPITLEAGIDLIASFGIITLLSFFYEFARGQAIVDLSEANEEMRRLIYVVSHDLRTPLTALRGYARFLREDLERKTIENMRGDIEKVELMSSNMGMMIDDLLNLSRVGRNIEEKVVFSTKDIVDLIVIESETAIKQKKINVQIVEPLPRIYSSRRKFEEVMRNLFSNAIKYMGSSENPYIEIGVVDKEKEYDFYVKDHGVGIDKKYHDKIFELFVRHENIGEGSGIGLSIVKGFVEDMGGKVWVNSRIGGGSTFWFSVPKEKHPVQTTSPEQDNSQSVVE
ncbi:HAMP domain-containing histidine kinase [candidate division WWE3 bacterium]|uniref:histidine kinase n=1 Tax=candidate division WWE3 bacterium TaxID=2053526 RepID=A0A955LKQ1_UNCKA|nr:HAMP domain-containing histidine kinase [candidate division WWE3 bacterium]